MYCNISLLVHQLGGFLQPIQSFRIIEDVEALRACRFAGEGCPLEIIPNLQMGVVQANWAKTLGPKNAHEAQLGKHTLQGTITYPPKMAF